MSSYPFSVITHSTQYEDCLFTWSFQTLMMNVWFILVIIASRISVVYDMSWINMRWIGQGPFQITSLNEASEYKIMHELIHSIYVLKIKERNERWQEGKKGGIEITDKEGGRKRSILFHWSAFFAIEDPFIVKSQLHFWILHRTCFTFTGAVCFFNYNLPSQLFWLIFSTLQTNQSF